MATKYGKVKVGEEVFTYSSGNSKVKFPIVNVGSGTDCASRAWCPFDQEKNKQAGRKVCYAQKSERVYPSVLKSRRMNESIIRNNDGAKLGQLVAHSLLEKVQKWGFDTVRVNESGDLAQWNMEFVFHLTLTLKANGIHVYLYSKAPKNLRDTIKKAGATVLHSERDFVAFGTKEELGKSGAIPCPGVCGPCKACPSFNGGKIGILEH